MLEIDKAMTNRTLYEVHWYYYLMGCLDEMKILLRQDDAYMKKKNDCNGKISTSEEIEHLAFCRMKENERFAYLVRYICADRKIKVESLTMRIWKEEEYWFPD